MSVPNNTIAATLKSLHKPGEPIVMANVYDGATAGIVAALPSCKAVATASYAIARAAGLDDRDLTLEINLAAVKVIAPIVKGSGKPLSADMQHGYGERLEDAMGKFIDAGISGCNLEDHDGTKMYSLEEAVSRIKRALSAALAHGVPDFALNARCDTLVHGGEIAEVIERGQAYLAAGATSVFVWGGKRGTSRKEIVTMVEAFQGRLNVRMKLGPGSLGVDELAKIGVARISVGPELQHKAMDTYAREAEKMLTGGY